MAATRYTANEGTTIATATLPNGAAPFNLLVIDWIHGGLTTSSVAAILLDVDGATMATTTVLSTGGAIAVSTVPVQIDFADGFPVWTAIDTDAVPETTVIVTLTGGGTATYAQLMVGYHYENPAQRRAINQERHG